MLQKWGPAEMEQGWMFRLSYWAKGGSRSLTEQMRRATGPYRLLASPPHKGSLWGTAKGLFALKQGKLI